MNFDASSAGIGFALGIFIFWIVLLIRSATRFDEVNAKKTYEFDEREVFNQSVGGRLKKFTAGS